MPSPSSATTTRSSSPAEIRIATSDARVLGHVGQGLPQDGEHRVGHRTGRDAIDRTGDGDPRVETESRTELVDEIEHLGVQTILLIGLLHVEDRLAELADRRVDALYGLTNPGHRFGPPHQAGGALEGEPDGEQPLNHRIVEVARDAVTVLHQGVIPDERVQPRVLYGDAGCERQREGQLLVVFGELGGSRLVGEVQVPVHLAVDADRYPEKGRHRRMVRRDPEAVLVVGDVRQSKRLLVGDKCAQHAPAGGPRPDHLLVLLTEPDGTELVQGASVAGQDAERTVSGADEVARHLHDATKHDGQVELRVEDEHRLDQSPKLRGVGNPVERLHDRQATHRVRVRNERTLVRHRRDRVRTPSHRRRDTLSHRGAAANVGNRSFPWQYGSVGIRVFVLDDHELVRTGLRTLLHDEDDMEVVGEAGTARDGLRLIGQLNPDVAILDVRLPDGNGIEVCREIHSSAPFVRSLMLTSYSDDEALFSSIMAGASGYILKEVGSGDLLGDIRRVSEGVSLLDPDLTQELFDRLRKDKEAESRLTVLTPQERRVLEFIAQGQSNRQIARELYLAEATVKNYVSSLLSKLGMRRRTEAAVYAAVLAERRASLREF